MYFGIVETESLEQQSLLTKYVPAKVIPQEVESADTKLWHLNVLKIEDAQGEEAAVRFAEVMLHGWYAVIWNDEIYYVILPKKAFQLRRGDGQSKDFEAMKIYAIENGVQEEYLDFNKNFVGYLKYAAEL